LNRVPAEARIAVVTESRALPDSEVRAQFRRVKPFGEITAGRRCCAAPILGQSGSSAPPCWTLDVLNIVLVSATVSVAVCTVPLRTSSTPSVRRDADRRERGARVPHFTRELEKLHPDISKAEGSHRRHGYGGQERLKAEVKTKTKLTPTVTSATTPQTTRGRNPPAITGFARYGFAVARRPSSPALRNSPDKKAVAGDCRNFTNLTICLGNSPVGCNILPRVKYE
jgi:hypothetical protein